MLQEFLQAFQGLYKGFCKGTTKLRQLRGLRARGLRFDRLKFKALIGIGVFGFSALGLRVGHLSFRRVDWELGTGIRV